MRHWLAASILAVAVAAGAQAGPAQRGPMRTFSDSAIPLTFRYPAELTPMAADAGTGCSRVLLKAELGTDPNESAAAAGSSGPWASLTVSDMGPGCFPAKALKKTKLMDQMLSGTAAGPTQVLGLMPMEQPLGYLLQGRHAFLAAAEGEPVSESALQPANGKEILAVIAAQVKDHIVVWRIASNDATLLNRVLAGTVDCGLGPPQALYPGHIGE